MNKQQSNPHLPQVDNDCAGCTCKKQAKLGGHCSEYRVNPEFKCEKRIPIVFAQDAEYRA